MFKKILLLGTVLAAGLPQADARITGFYVGIQGGAQVQQFKVHDASSHHGTKHSETIDGNFEYLGIGLTQSTYTIDVPDEFTENEDFEATPNYQYRVRPMGNFFVGYNYQIGSRFVVGLELTGGMTFGKHEFHEYTRTCDLKHWGLDANNVLKEKTSSPINDILMQNFDIKEKFRGEASLRLGFIMPGSNGKLALFLRGGAGFVNRELTSNLVGSKEFYSSAVFDDFYRHGEAKAEALRTDDGSKDGERYGYLNIIDPCYYAYKISTGDVFDNTDKTAVAGKTLAEAAQYLVGTLLDYGKTGDKLLLYGFDSDFNVEDSKTEWTWHVGGDLEYHFCSGAFIRASYTFRYMKGFFVEQSKDVISPKYADFTKMMKNQITDGLLVMDPLKGNDGNIAIQGGNTTEDALITEMTKEGGAVDTIFNSLSGKGANLGSINYKVGLGKKSFSHEFALGVGYKF